jgi:zinc transport system substrate-binding protein
MDYNSASRYFLLFGILLLFSGCAQELPTNNKIIAATIFPMADWCRNMVPPEVEVQCLIPPNISPHTFEPGIREAKTLSRAQLAVCIGKHFDGWVEPLIRGTQGNSVEILNLIELETGEVHYFTQPHAHEDDDPVHNPHLWVDPIWAQEAILKISERLKQLWPDQAAVLDSRTQDYLFQLRELHLEISRTINEFKYKKYVGFHGSFVPFAHRYGLEEVLSIEPWAGKEPSVEYAKQVVETLRKMEHPVIFVEPQLDRKVAKVFAEEAKCPVLVMDPLGDPHQPDRNSYINLMRYNLKSLKQGLSASHE